MDMPSLLLLLCLHICFCSAYEGSGQHAYGDDEDWYSHAFQGSAWCAPVKVKHGDVSCQPPRGQQSKSAMGARCKIRCKQGYESQSSEVVCMASKHWSSNYACREIRCPKMNMPVNGGYKCSDGSYYNSRCEFFCSQGFLLKGAKTATCQYNKAWSAAVPACVDEDPPKIKCPHVKEKWAEPGKLTARVSWDTPEGLDTADGVLTDVILKGKAPKSDFPEGLHKMSYTVMDRAGNKGSCRFTVRVRVRRCSPLSPPDNGYMKCDSDGDNYGATCQFTCAGGADLQGSAARVCQYGLTWSGSDANCAPMNINVGVRRASALLDQFYEKRRLLIISAPTAANHNYRFQMTNLQHAQCGLDLRHVTVIELVGNYPAQIGRIRHRLLPPMLALQLRLLLQIPQRSFQMVLVDKQGTDKQRYPFPITAAELFATVDTLPLRKDEMLLQQAAGQSCQS
ncbi:sushi repeat-containing protein SRPX [Corythoichthys intestinalis]|uniref:sushi repeat-containing protein SRPX n=1 Tax=Corythoichthys intestinalis TaxID=161448 RepID=UPI0025A626E3|nr:sushi repeat-containing protein SRPX [Corythoichthys intestinalis]XP_057707829.1 sushi repeat-containing protein SRPX [Corythoichthys intestinalis]XP_057707830.1 sushi repeat-containing protein SRPX [Corythoichthys intestinalis]XP_061799936.1 sushi-repeat-containing protein SRPX-like [Nerophis lumbriciformis]